MLETKDAISFHNEDYHTALWKIRIRGVTLIVNYNTWILLSVDYLDGHGWCQLLRKEKNGYEKTRWQGCGDNGWIKRHGTGRCSVVC